MIKQVFSIFWLVLSVITVNAFGQVQAVYDATVHQQSILNHEALVRSHDKTRAWLSTILEQDKIATMEIYNTKVDVNKKLDETAKKLEDKIGDPTKLKTHVAEVAPGQLYENKSLAEIRAEGINNKKNSNYNASQLYGDDKKGGAAGRVGEAAYVNYENVLLKSSSDKLALYRKREALAAYLDSTKNLVEIEKIKAGIALIDSRLQSLYENEKNAALKVLAIKTRNDLNREIKEDQYSDAIPVASQAMSERMVDNFKNLGKEDKKK